MGLVGRSTKWVMLISGLLTCTMFYAAVAPEASLRSNFGETLEGPVAQIVVRSWGVLIGLVGLMLIHGAFHSATQRMALLVAGISKLAFVSLILVYGRQLLAFQIGTSLVVDSVMIVLFGLCLLASNAKGVT